jgi:hypothetical protein
MFVIVVPDIITGMAVAATKGLGKILVLTRDVISQKKRRWNRELSKKKTPQFKA